MTPSKGLLRSRIVLDRPRNSKRTKESTTVTAALGGTKTGPNYFGDRTLVSASNATDKALLKEQRQSMLSLERCSPRMEATVLAIRGKSLRLRALLQNAANESLLSAVYDAIE